MSVEAREATTLKIVQRLPMDDVPHAVRISRLADRLVRKYQRVAVAQKNEVDEQNAVEKRANTYTIKTAPTPAQANSAGIYQDGTDYSYFTPITFGSASTKMYMLLDTGADQSWVMGSTCTSGPCTIHNLYDPSTSSTSKSLTTLFSINYGSGSVAGHRVTDNISFAGLNLALTFGLANTTSDDFNNFPIDGILGLSLGKSDTTSFIDTLVASKSLKSNVFGISLNRMSDGPNTGEINFGAPDTTRFTGSLNYMPVDVTNGGGDWAIPMDNVGFAKAQAGLTGRLAFLDTGTSFIFCPASDAAVFHALIKGAVSDDKITYHVPCTTTDSINFTFGGTAYSVPSKDWIGPEANGNCTSNIYGRTVVGNNWLVGDTFLKNVYAVFDIDKTRVGLAPVVTPTVTSSSTAPVVTSSAIGASSGIVTSSGSTPHSTNAVSSTNISGATPTATTASPGLNGHQTSATIGTAAAETASPSAAASQTQKSDAKRLNTNLIATLLAASFLVKNLT